jgi:WhiB family redox-sensing transcriptional regulator
VDGERWRDRAACASRPDVDWFDVDCYLNAALTICSTCPVADECLDYAIRHDCYDGLWGGEWGYRLQQLIRAGRADRGRGYRGREGRGRDGH